MFEIPIGLPPSRFQDHKIVLKDKAQPINLRPYKYRGLQKDVIGQMVKEILEECVITNSSNSHASPVALVKKNDGS